MANNKSISKIWLYIGVFLLCIVIYKPVYADTKLNIIDITNNEINFDISFFNSGKYLRANHVYEGYYPNVNTEVCGNENFNWRFDQNGYQYLLFDYPNATFIPAECFVPYDGHFWYEMIDEDSNAGYIEFTIISGEVQILMINTLSRIDSFSYSTSTQIARLTGYWTAPTTEGITERINFWQDSTLLGRESFREYVATTTGFFDFSFFFHGLPISTTTQGMVFGLYATLKEVDDTNVSPDWNPFSHGAIPTGRETELLDATSTIVGIFDYNLPVNVPPRNYTFSECSLGFQFTGSAPFFKFEGFDLGLCMANIFVAVFEPTPEQSQENIRVLKEDIYRRAPLGYIARIQEILTSTTTVAMPVIDYTFSTSSASALSPILGGERIYLAPFEYATGTGITSIKSDGANGLPQKNIWEIMEPFYITVLGLMLFMMMYHDLTGLIPEGGSRGSERDDETYKLKTNRT